MDQIPKIIHYCWFGNSAHSNIQEICFASWKKHLSDYEFILWDEKNSDLEHPFIQFAYNRKKFAFVADYVRLKAVYDYGGVYLDTDMFVVQNFDKFLNQNFFIGAQDENLINASIFGGIKKHDYIKECLKYYDDQSPRDWQLKLAIPRVLTRVFDAYTNTYNTRFNSVMEVKGLKIYPAEYFYPLPFDVNKPFQKNFLNYAVDNTVTIHLWEGSWIEYDIFQLIRKRKYLEAVKKIDFNKKLNFKFIKKCIRALLYSIKS